MKNRGNEPAHSVVTGNYVHNNGMTIREQFAMAAMQGLIARGDIPFEDIDQEATEMADRLIRRLVLTRQY